MENPADASARGDPRSPATARARRRGEAVERGNAPTRSTSTDWLRLHQASRQRRGLGVRERCVKVAILENTLEEMGYASEHAQNGGLRLHYSRRSCGLRRWRRHRYFDDHRQHFLRRVYGRFDHFRRIHLGRDYLDHWGLPGNQRDFL